MKLDIDCLRDVLICVEDNTGLHQSCVFYDVPVMEKVCSLMGKEKPDIPGYQAKLLENKKYGNDVLFYHVLQCVEGGLIKRVEGTAEYEAVITGFTFKGHDFLGNIRNPKVWGKILEFLDKHGDIGIAAIIANAGKIASFLTSVASNIPLGGP